MNNPLLYSYEEAAQNVARFEKLLNKIGIEISESSALRNICEKVLKLTDKNYDFEGERDVRPFYREVLGLNDLIIKILQVEKHPQFAILKDHLKLLNSTDSIGQTTKNVITDQNSNKIFELFIAATCMNLSDEVTIDSPKKSKGDNPDILVKFNNQTWGIACKNINTEILKVKTIMDNIEKGIDQIEKSPAEIGIVIVNLKNIIFYDDIFPILNLEDYNKGKDPVYGAFPNIDYPSAMLSKYGDTINNEIITNHGWNAVNSLFKGKKSIPGTFLFLQCATSIKIDTKIYPSTLGIFHLLKFSPYLEFLSVLNQAMHNI